jgi:hypothetical protein
MIVMRGYRRAILSSVAARIRSELTSDGVSGLGRFTIPVWNSTIMPYFSARSKIEPYE